VYTYRARAFNAAGDSPYSNEAASSPAAFADEPLTAGTTPVRAVHIGELRQTVDASRACAGLGTAAWTDSIAADVAIKAVHVQELRDNLRPARDRFGMPAVSYTDDPLTPGVLIKKVHVDELRQAVR
ncbi:MAG: hypothetical protein HY315_04605, partial [Acidobacteria bacterium]|nr:hypothetical protein [Acidobacteriota bacterium]